MQGLIQSFIESTFVGQTIVVVLALASVFAWVMMLFKMREFRNTASGSATFLYGFRKETHPLALFVQRKRADNSPCYRIYLRACHAATRVLGEEVDRPESLFMPGSAALSAELSDDEIHLIREAAEREMAAQVLLLEKEMAGLATTIAVAPFMGLLGTVWGVMDAFNGMAVTGTATMSAVAPGIAAALLTTIIGLLVAIPSTIGYNILNAKLRTQTVGLDSFVQELVGEFHLTYARRGQR